MRIPYLYIITHVISGKIYIGSKTAKNADPSLFMVTYFTSSDVVRKIIKEEGVEAFKVEIIPQIDVPKNVVIENEHAMIAEAIRKYGKEMILNRFVYTGDGGKFIFSAHKSETIEKMKRMAKERCSGITPELWRIRRIKAEETIRAKKAAGWVPEKRTSESKLKGIAKTDETRLKMSLARKGKPVPGNCKPKKPTIFRFRNPITGNVFEGTQYDFIKAHLPNDEMGVSNLCTGKVRRNKTGWEVFLAGQWSGEKARKHNATNDMRYICTHCGISTNPVNFARWHGDKCREVDPIGHEKRAEFTMNLASLRKQRGLAPSAESHSSPQLVFED